MGGELEREEDEEGEWGVSEMEEDCCFGGAAEGGGRVGFPSCWIRLEKEGSFGRCCSFFGGFDIQGEDVVLIQ